MPPVRNLTPSPAHHSPAEPAATVAKLQPGPRQIAVPSFISAMPMIPTAFSELPDAGSGPYLSIANERSKKWPALQQAGLVAGDFYVTLADKFIRVMPCRFFMLCANIFKTRMDSLGNITAATRDMADRDLAEHVVAVLLVECDGELVPVVTDMMRAMANAFIEAARAVEAAATPEWTALSPAHAAAAAFPAVAGRVMIQATTTRPTAKSSGNQYIKTLPQIFPATAAEMQRFANAVQDEDTVAKLTAAKEAFDRKVKQLTAICDR